MSFILWIVIGGLLGWLASIVMKTDAEQGVLLNVLVGIAGAFIGGLVLGPMLGTGTINTGDYSKSGVFASFAGALALLAIVNAFRRGRVR
jgi:uncharacterized membrane protein YeaQ/YmgE (transglycosylase-associated protein family)